jgi:hypothetical protein
MIKQLTRVLAAAAVLSFQAHAGIILNFFPVSDYNANTTIMNTTLGITGYTFEDFETTPLLPGLTIVLTGGVPTTTFSTLPNLLDQTVCGSLTDNSAWDGTHVVANLTTNSFAGNCNGPPNISTNMTVNYAPGTTSLGVGFGNFQSTNPAGAIPITNHELFVNGIDMGTIESKAGAAWTPGLARNAYLRVDGTGGTVITSITVMNISAPDVLFMDHVAIAPGVAGVPEPSTALPVILAAVFLGLKARRQSFLGLHTTEQAASLSSCPTVRH